MATQLNNMASSGSILSPGTGATQSKTVNSTTETVTLTNDCYVIIDVNSKRCSVNCTWANGKTENYIFNYNASAYYHSHTMPLGFFSSGTQFTITSGEGTSTLRYIPV